MRKVLAFLVFVALLSVAYYAGSQRGREAEEVPPPGRAAGDRFQPGDTAVVIADRVELRDGQAVLARLGKECRLSVQRLSGSWAGGTVQISGKTIFGWVHERHLDRLESDVKPQLATTPRRPESADTAIKQRLAGIEAQDALAATSRSLQAGQGAPTAEPATPPLASVESIYAAPSLGMRVAVAREPADLQELASLQSIERLIITGEAFNNEALRQLEGLQIQSLSIECPNIGNGGLIPVSKIKDLRELRLWTLGVNDAGLELVTAVRDLELLDLEGTSVRGEGLARLHELTRLSHLTLGPNVTDESLSSLKALSNLTELDLRACHQLTEACFNKLRELQSLRSIWLPSRLVEPGIARLKQDLPGCVVRQ